MPPRKPRIPVPQPATPPEPLARFVDQPRVVDYFARVGAQGLAPAYLFWGPPGVGKRTFARTLAITLHCERPTSFPLGYCGECAHCLRGLHGSSGDTVYVDEGFIKATNATERVTTDIGVDNIHEMLELMQMRSYEGGRLVCIVPELQHVTKEEVFNVMLKTLEESPGDKLFLFTAQTLEAILPTIRSRCTLVRFGPLSMDVIAAAVRERAGADAERANLIARRAQGSLGRALADAAGDNAIEQAVREWIFACLEQPGSLPPMPALDADDAGTSLEAIVRQARITTRDLMAAAMRSGAFIEPDGNADYGRVVEKLGDRALSATTAAVSAAGQAERIAATNVAPAMIVGWLQSQLRTAAG